MTKDEVKATLKPLIELLKTLEDKFSVDIRIVEAESVKHQLSHDANQNYRLEDGCQSDNIIVDIRLCHDAMNDARGQSPVGSDCLKPHRNTA